MLFKTAGQWLSKMYSWFYVIPSILVVPMLIYKINPLVIQCMVAAQSLFWLGWYAGVLAWLHQNKYSGKTVQNKLFALACGAFLFFLIGFLFWNGKEFRYLSALVLILIQILLFRSIRKAMPERSVLFLFFELCSLWGLVTLTDAVQQINRETLRGK